MSSSSSHEPYDAGNLPELLKFYYKRFFPYNLFYRWLNYGNSENSRFFGLREFCFTLKDDVYLRYKSFESQKELEEAIQEYCPYRIEIGPVYSTRIKDVKMNASVMPVERELIFDIDMTDYDEVRICCSGAEICRKCWSLMVLAIKIIHRILTEDFGFQNLLWVFSGRRGIHCWVADKKARFLKPAARHAIVDYITLIKGGNQGKARSVHLSNFDVEHQSVAKSLFLVRSYFLKHFVKEEKIMKSERGVAKVLAMLEDPSLMGKVQEAIENINDGERRWEKLTNLVEEFVAFRKKQPESWKINNMLDELQVAFCYPRLDANVSHGLNHLLKSPFSVHPKTGRICVPINPDQVEKFDPFSVPTIAQLMEEVTEYNNAHPETTPIIADENTKSILADWKKTSLKEGIQVFETFVRKLELNLKRENSKENPIDF